MKVPYVLTLHLRETSRLKDSIQGGSQNAWVWLPCLNLYGVFRRLILVPHSSHLLAGMALPRLFLAPYILAHPLLAYSLWRALSSATTRQRWLLHSRGL